MGCQTRPGTQAYPTIVKIPSVLTRVVSLPLPGWHLLGLVHCVSWEWLGGGK